MNQDPPVLIPYVEKDIYNDISTNQIEHKFVSEPVLNGYLTNGNKSPPMPTLYEADREPPLLFNMQDIFSALTKTECDEYDYSTFESRNDSSSLFEKIYKDFSTTFNNSSNQISSIKNSTIPQIENSIESRVKIEEPDVIVQKHDNIVKESNALEEHNDIDKESHEIVDNEKCNTVIPLGKESCISKNVAKKTRKRKIKKVIDHESDIEDFKKYGIKTVPKRKSDVRSATTTNTTHYVHGKELNDNKYLRSPFITLRHCTPKKLSTTTNVISSSYEIVNPVLRGSTDNHTSIYRPNTKAFVNVQYSTTTLCLCAFCGNTSEFLQLGSLYGPYFIERDSVHTLPLTSIFPSESNEIGVSGKSAIKSDKNGNLKMVIQSTRNSRNNSSKKIQIDDYRVTWEGEVWFHRECVLWAPGTFLRGDGKIGGLDEALKMALNAECFVCHKIGAILNCTTKNCEKNFHYYCAICEDAKLNCDQFSVLCNKHKDR